MTEGLYAGLGEIVDAEAQKIMAKHPITSRFPGHSVRPHKPGRPRKVRLYVMTPTEKRRLARQHLTSGQVNSIVKAVRAADNQIAEIRDQAQKYGVRPSLIWKIHQEHQGAYRLRKAMKILNAQLSTKGVQP